MSDPAPDGGADRELPNLRAAPISESMSETEAKPEPDTAPKPKAPDLPKEIGGPSGPEPTRYGDWEKNGRCSDF